MIMTKSIFKITEFDGQNILYYPVNELGITHKDILAQNLFRHIRENKRFEDRDKIISVISSGSFCRALEVENIAKYHSEFEIRVLIDYRNLVLEQELKNNGIKTFLTDLDEPLKSHDILRVTNNANGFDFTDLAQYENFNPYSEVALVFKKTLERSRKQIKNVFVPFGSGNLHQSLQNLDLPGITIWGCIPSAFESSANKLIAKFRPFSNLTNILKFDEVALNKVIHSLGYLNLEPSALAGFAAYNQHRSQIEYRSGETVIITTGNSNNYSEVLKKARLKLENDKS
jgi:hypothetical protein